jgi:hypothetical protein
VERLSFDISANDETGRAFASAEASARQMAGAIDRSAGAAASKVSGAGVQVGNLTAQLSDVATQLAGGQSPFMIMMQQGTQISAALGTGTGLRGAVAGLGAAFASLLSPVNLAVAAVMMLGGTAISYFASGKSEAAKTDEALKAHGAVIASIKDRYGEAAAGLRAYAGESTIVLAAQSKLSAERLRTQLQTEAAAVQAGLKSMLALPGVDVTTGKALGGMSADLMALSRAATEFVGSVRAGAPAVEQFRERLAGIALSSADQRTREVAGSMLDLTGRVGETSRALQSAEGAAARTDAALRGVGMAAAGALGPLSSFSEALAAMRATALTLDPRAALAANLRKALDAATDAKDAAAAINENAAAVKRLDAAEAARSAKIGTREARTIDPYERATMSINEKVAALGIETAMVGRSNADKAYATTLEDLNTAAKERNIKAGQAGRALSESEIAANRAQAESMRAATAERDAATKAHDTAVAQADQMRSSFTDLGSTFLNTWATAGSGAEAFRATAQRALQMVIDQMLKMAALRLFGPIGTVIGGATGGSAGPMVLHEGGVVGAGGVSRSVSSSLFAGAPRYHRGGIAGLKPGEIPAILRRGEIVDPGDGSMLGGGGTVIHQTINAPGATAQSVAMLAGQMQQMAAQLGRLQRAPEASRRGMAGLG